MVLRELTLGAFIMRVPDPERIAPVYDVTAGVVNSLAAGAGQMQAYCSPPPKSRDDRTIFTLSPLTVVLRSRLERLIACKKMSGVF